MLSSLNYHFSALCLDIFSLSLSSFFSAEILKKFRITGTQTTMRMCKSLWGEDNPEIEYGLTCTSGPLGGDAQLAELMCAEELGALIFFADPLSAHPHQADIDSLLRLANVGNIIVCPNPTSAMSMLQTLKVALERGDRGMVSTPFPMLTLNRESLVCIIELNSHPIHTNLSSDSFFLRDARISCLRRIQEPAGAFTFSCHCREISRWCSTTNALQRPLAHDNEDDDNGKL